MDTFHQAVFLMSNQQERRIKKMSTNIMPNWLLKRAELTPERIALSYHDQVFTFFQLHEAAKRTANQLGSLGIRKGDHIAVLVQNSLDSVVLIHALQFIGAVTVFLNTRLTPYELAWQITDSHATTLLFDEHNHSKATEIQTHIQIQNHSDLRILSIDELKMLQEVEIALQSYYDLSDVQSIIYTSGTTGNPKGVQLSYGNHWWSAIGSTLNIGLHSDDRWLACVPFFHVSGLSILMRSVIYGITVLIYESFDPKAVNAAIQEQNVTIISVVSNMLARMLDDLQESDYPGSFRCMLVGGGPVPKHLLEACKERKIPIYQTYGMTETASQIVTLAPEYMLTKLGSAGKALFPAELRIKQNEIILGPGEIGEIVVRGPNITKGYFQRPDATDNAIIDGWLHTGDLGYVDEEGFLYVVDRRSDLIISGGENVYPAEIEAVLSSHPAVLEAGVTGIEDEKWGAVPLAFVKLDPNTDCSSDELKAFCNARLASYKIPHTIYFVEEIPRNAANKILRRKLKDLLLS